MIRLNYILFIVLTFISCSAQEEITIRKDIFGFATSNSFTYCDFSDSVLSNKIVQLSPRLLRFPGGAVGNFYHFVQIIFVCCLLYSQFKTSSSISPKLE